ncbi:MAG TPA: fibronectin type III domain-containing protein [Actinomycetes bacterium]|nr:fibronectin type III domain-containing protein [Actinomycetes bacterium]
MNRKSFAVLVVALLAASVLLLVPGRALADVPIKASPTWQTNGIVYAVAYTHGNVYIGGSFTRVRPPGAAAGTREVTRNHIAAFNATTGALTSFKHNVNSTVYSLLPSPSGARLYVGGDFTAIDGAARGHLGAFAPVSGALLGTWKPSVTGRVKSISTFGTGTTLYVGGTFGTAGGQPRTNVAAFNSSGGLLPFRATPDASVRALIVSADGSRIVIGGSFSHVNGVARHALAILSTAGTVQPQQSVIPTCSQVTSFARTATAVFLGAEGTGGGCFDGTLALNPRTGAQLWRDNCLGATQAVQVIGTWLYVGSHAHNCSGVVGGFGETSPPRHLMREAVSNGHIDSHWFPNTNGNPLGPRSLGSDGTRLGVGGDFTKVNNKLQQGFTQFG